MHTSSLTIEQLLDYFIHHATMHDTGNDQRPFFVQCELDSITLMAEASTPWDAYNSLVDSAVNTHPLLIRKLMSSLTKHYYNALSPKHML